MEGRGSLKEELDMLGRLSQISILAICFLNLKLEGL